jgi:glycosyltransferase involved in cell wall biosynthesis
MPDADDQRSDSIELSVVIAAYDAAGTIGDQLRALLDQDWDGSWEIVVADNGSGDKTRQIVERAAASDSRVRLVDSSDRRGPAHARNVGVSHARGPSIAFCDADDMVGEGWLAAMGEAMRLSSMVTGPQEHERLNPEWLHGIYGTAPASELQTFSGIFAFGPAANLGIHRELFEQLGGFDASLTVGEDIDLCLRAWLRGERPEFVAGAVVHYRYRERLRDLWHQAVQYGATRPMIARRLSEAGLPMPSRLSGARNWIWLLRRLPSLRSRAGRARWAVVAGGSLGRIIGSVRQRYLVL